MKFLVAFTVIVAVASAGVTRPTKFSAEIAEIIAAIQSPSTNPATAAALEAMLLDVLGIVPEPIAVGPAIVEEIAPEPIIAVNPVVIEPTPVDPSPVVIGEIPEGATPLVQIIVNVNNKQEESFEPIAVGPAIVEEIVAPEPIIVVNPIVVHPIVEEPTFPGPVNVVDQVIN